jgi:predicted porin
MNKKLIAAAVASACVLAAPAAQAEITVYSNIQFELTNTDIDGSDSTTTVNDKERGRLGIKGGHDLGGGLKSVALAEFDFEGGNKDAEFGGTSANRAAFRVREINAGLKGAFGTIRLGTVKSAYKYSGGVKYDPFVTTALEARGVGMSGAEVANGRNKAGGHNGFLNNAFQYNIKAGMVKVHATYSLDDTDADSGTANDDDGEYTLGVTVGNKKWEAGFALYNEGVSVSTENQENQKLFGKISFGNSTILAQWEVTDTGAASNGETDYKWLGYNLKLGKGLLNAQYATVDPDGTNNDRDMITVGYIHKFNKQTRIFAGYQTIDYDAASSDSDEITLGIRVDI